jgi:FdhD protein
VSKKLDKGVRERPVHGSGAPRQDRVVVEEPLEIRVAGEPLAITMRTPGDDHFLALGFLFSEGVISSIADVGSVAHCGRPDEEGYGNTIDVTPGPGVALDPERLRTSRRGTLTTASCGVCGRRSIDDLLDRIAPLSGHETIPRAVVSASPGILREGQANFERTGGIHAAAALDATGAVCALAEDVGRHNAVDKVVGELISRPDRAAPGLLVVSGRVSFEIVQKAAVARIPVVAAISAPTSLAIDLAAQTGIALAAFVRDGEMNVYTHPERLD